MDKTILIEAYFKESHPYKNAIGTLRGLVLTTDLEETFKWKFPTYTLKNKNVLALCKFKSYFGIWFFNGAFLPDPLEVLENAQEGKTKLMRQWRFTHGDQINKKQLLRYINAAIAHHKNGKTQSKTIANKVICIPDLLHNKLRSDKALKAAFDRLTPYRQKEFCEHIKAAKRQDTKIRRLQKAVPMIMAGVGLNDIYR